MSTHFTCSIRSGGFAFCWLFAALPAVAAAAERRQVVSLNGTWEIAESTMTIVPQRFDHTVVVPGLVDMAQPAFAEVGTKQSGKHREAFWYRRTFTLPGKLPAVAELKIHKACFGTRVYLNGRLVGDHLPCFTPGLFDVREHINGDGAMNELVIRVGAERESVPRSIPDGWDFEKIKYIPGIYDAVDLILCDAPRIVNVQTVPDLTKKEVRCIVELSNPRKTAASPVTCRVVEAASGKEVGKAELAGVELPAGGGKSVELRVPIEGCRLWSPDDPFLYRLTVETSGDQLSTRFGMRTFHFDPQTKVATLNGKPYPLRGTNVCIYRFFEDPDRGDRPWRGEWVRRLHETFRQMHWNSCRYCIGFPPEAWYDIADETGLMIQDEFPIWYLGQWPAELKADELVREYSAWMRERWNHPCVIIWDAQNETKTEETGKAIGAVRGLDLSNRPWDNGWAKPQAATDVYEAHPYAMYCKDKPTQFRLSQFAGKAGAPGVPGGLGGGPLQNTGGNPTIINEYCWLWLNRDGSPTTLTKPNYELFVPGGSVEDRRRFYNRVLAAKTEFWRAHRQVPGVLHFCGLGYSRADGQTSDHFTDLEKLTIEPNFQKYVRDAFSPVGLMIDFWAEEILAGKTLVVPVIVISDLQKPWEGEIRLRLVRGEKTVAEESQVARLDPIGRQTLRFDLPQPDEKGNYQLIAELKGPDGKPVQSLRDVKK